MKNVPDQGMSSASTMDKEGLSKYSTVCVGQINKICLLHLYRLTSRLDDNLCHNNSLLYLWIAVVWHFKVTTRPGVFTKCLQTGRNTRRNNQIF